MSPHSFDGLITVIFLALLWWGWGRLAKAFDTTRYGLLISLGLLLLAFRLFDDDVD